MRTKYAILAPILALALTGACVAVKPATKADGKCADKCTSCFQVCRPGDGVMVCQQDCVPIDCDKTLQRQAEAEARARSEVRPQHRPQRDLNKIPGELLHEI